ncbi:MAG: hypothetical protein IJ328_03315 [Muribaculaceae bacterium]|nr:hypothetical protein [Muribaculaceae bacterium]
MAEQYFAPNQINKGRGFTLKMSGKLPVVAERIWKTYSDALEYVNDFNGTATDGLILSILNDSVVDSVTYKAGVYYVKKAATAEGANDGELVPTGMSEADLTALIDSKIEGAVASFGTASMSGNVLTLPYTNIKGEQKSVSITLNTATTAQNGLMTKEHVASLNKKLEGVTINGNAFPVSGNVASGEFTFGLNADTMQIVLALNGDVIGSVDASDFVLDGILDDVALAEADGSGNAGTFMKFTFNAASGKTPIYLNVEKLIDIYDLVEGEVTGGTFVTPTLTITGSGTSSDPWKVNLSINDTSLVNNFSDIRDLIKVNGQNIETNTHALEALQEQVQGIVSRGGEANTIVKITLNGVELAPNADRVVNIPLASSTAAGAMSASDKAKLDGITAITDDEIDTILAG